MGNKISGKAKVSIKKGKKKIGGGDSGAFTAKMVITKKKEKDK